MKRIFGVTALPVIVTALAVAILAIAAPSAGRADDSAPAAPAAAASTSTDRAAFRDGMRKLWEDHVTWTRLYIVSAAAGLPDTQATADRLLRNQADLGGAIVPYYGADAGERLTELLTEHITIATELIGAAKHEDQRDTERASEDWYANADDEVHVQILGMADMLSEGIVARFPLRFSE